jgi:hypothetical protein
MSKSIKSLPRLLLDGEEGLEGLDASHRTIRVVGLLEISPHALRIIQV